MTNNPVTLITEEQIADLFRVLGQPVRVQILLLIEENEACVCHLEAYLGLRQAAISQHLMVLRDAGLVTAHRDGRNIYYRLTRPDLLVLLHQAAAILGISPEEMRAFCARPSAPCLCPHCNPDKIACMDCG